MDTVGSLVHATWQRKCGRAKSEKKSKKTNKLNYNYVTIIHRWTAVVQDATLFKYAVHYIGGWGKWKTFLDLLPSEQK